MHSDQTEPPSPKRAAELLQSDEAFFRTMIENSLAGIYVIQDHRFRYVNPALAHIFGYEAAEMINRLGPLDVTHPDDADRVAENIRMRLQGETKTIHYIFRGVRKDGQVIYCEVMGSYAEYQNAPAVVGTLIDVTQRQQAEEALRHSEKHYRSMFEEHAAVKLLIDPLNGMIVDANPSACAFYGYSRDALQSMKISDLNMLPPEEIFHEMKRAATRQQGYFVFPHRLASGEIRTVEVRSGPVEIQGKRLLYSIIHDISERKQTQEALRQSEERYRALVEHSPDAIYVNRQGTILFTNQAMLRLVGANDESQVVGHFALEFVHPAYHDLIRERLRLFTSHNLPAPPVEQQFVRLDGSIVDVEVTAVPILFDGENAVQVIVRNISERKQLEQAEKLRQEMENERELIALRERFVSVVSHEFRTPLSVIMIASDVLERYRRQLSAEQQAERLQEIRKQVRYMSDMMEGILKIGRARAGKVEFQPTPIHVEALCSALMNQVSLTYGSDQHLFRLHNHNVSQAMMLDEKLLSQILSNLLSNAVKYSPNGGEVRLDVWQEDGQVAFQVRDQGLGIPEAEQNHIFEAFTRASNTGDIPGTGLGLAIVKESVELHGGTITVESREGEGTTFTVRLPVG